MPLRTRDGAVLGFLLLAAAGLSGCGQQAIFEGEPNFNTAVLLPTTADSSRNITRLDLKPTALPSQCQDDTITGTALDNCFYIVKGLIDDSYREYRITLQRFIDTGNAGADVSILGLTTASTGPVGALAHSVLSGVATLVGGARTAVNQDILYKTSIENIIHQMDADRHKRFTVILAKLKPTSPPTPAGAPGYSWPNAKDDLLVYFAAGTMGHALVSLQTVAATNQANCETENDKAQTGAPQSATTSAATCPAQTQAPTPAPQTPPISAAPPGPWPVSFESNLKATVANTTLDPTAETAVSAAATAILAALKSNAALTITVTGYIDASGTPAQNAGLATQRASLVAQELAADLVKGGMNPAPPIKVLPAAGSNGAVKAKEADISLAPKS